MAAAVGHQRIVPPGRIGFVRVPEVSAHAMPIRRDHLIGIGFVAACIRSKGN